MQRKKERGFSLVELLIVVAIIGIIAAIAVPRLLVAQQAARETRAFKEVQAIGTSQNLYALTKGSGKYATLAELGSSGVLNDQALATGNKGGYLFQSTPIEVEGMPSMFDTTAKPTSTGTFGSGNKSYYSNEALDPVVYDAVGADPPTATPQDRMPKTGTQRTQ
jgi:type IV pilus assembly protein PilA